MKTFEEQKAEAQVRLNEEYRQLCIEKDRAAKRDDWLKGFSKVGCELRDREVALIDKYKRFGIYPQLDWAKP